MARLLLALLLLGASAASAERLVVVLPDRMTPAHEEALEAFAAAFPERFVRARPSTLPPGPHGAVVALGAQAERAARTADGPLVVALSAERRPAPRGKPVVRVEMTPSPERFVEILARAGRRHLLALRATPFDPEFARRTAAAGERAGVRVEEVLLGGPDSVAPILRAHRRTGDSVWLSPEPDAVSPQAFRAVREFARARGLPFFAPTAGLAAGEIRPDLAASFRDCGAAAAKAVKDILAGARVPETVYPEPSSSAALSVTTTTAR